MRLPIEKIHADCLGSKETLRRRLSRFTVASLSTYLSPPELDSTKSPVEPLLPGASRRTRPPVTPFQVSVSFGERHCQLDSDRPFLLRRPPGRPLERHASEQYSLFFLESSKPTRQFVFAHILKGKAPITRTWSDLVVAPIVLCVLGHSLLPSAALDRRQRRAQSAPSS